MDVASAPFVVPDHTWEATLKVPFSTVDTALVGRLIIKCYPRIFKATAAVVECLNLLADSGSEDNEALAPCLSELSLGSWIEL